MEIAGVGCRKVLACGRATGLGAAPPRARGVSRGVVRRCRAARLARAGGGRRRGVRLPPVSVLAPALPTAARACADRLALRADLRARHAAGGGAEIATMRSGRLDDALPPEPPAEVPQLTRTREEATRLHVRLDRLTLRAGGRGGAGVRGDEPRPGRLHGEGGAGLVPAGAPPEVLAYVIDDVATFPYIRFGMLEAEMVKVAGDAVPGDAALQAQGDATQPGGRDDAAGASALSPQAWPVSDLVFTTRLRPAAQAVEVNGCVVPPVPGTTVTVRAKTGRCWELEQLFSSLVKVASTAMRGQ